MAKEAYIRNLKQPFCSKPSQLFASTSYKEHHEKKNRNKQNLSKHNCQDFAVCILKKHSIEQLKRTDKNSVSDVKKEKNISRHLK